jgi:3-deoxy-D-manno-octulosonic-acid transferase
VAGSTQGDEERIVLDAFINLQRRFEGLRLILVPRHPERFQHVSEILEKSAVGFVRRSQFSDSKLPTAGPDRKVILWDTMGELSALWGLADLGFVGGSLNCGRGGQSMIEPAGFGVPTCFGPEIWNFQEVADKLVGANAAVCLSHADQLLRVLADWLENPHSAATVGENARRFITSQLGATAITAEALAELLSAESTTQHRAA